MSTCCIPFHLTQPVLPPSLFAVEMTGNIPPGNAPGETRWQARRVAPLKKEIRLTAGKPISGITMEQLIDRVVKDNKVGEGFHSGHG